MNIVKILGSLWFAVFLMASLVIILIVSTSLESAYGTPFVQKFFYRAGWFDVFLAVLAVNIFCSTLVRYPFKKYQIGFVITHIGILTVLAGALLSRLTGVEGQMALYEGEHQNTILMEGYELIVRKPNGQTNKLDLKPYSGTKPRRLDVSDKHSEFFVYQVLENAVESIDIKDGAPGDSPNRAIQFTLKSEMAGFEESLWLVEKNPFNPHSSRISLGPAFIELKNKKPEKLSAPEATDSPSIHIRQQNTGKELWIDLTKPPQSQIPLSDSGLTLSNIHYYPDARVEGSQLVNISDKPLNPAVTFEVSDTNGHKEKHTRFALFPDFESLHGKNRENLFGLTVELSVPSLTSSQGTSGGPSLVFYPENKKWLYQSSSSKGETAGEIETDKTYPAGWMDFSFSVEKLLERAVVSKEITRAEGSNKGQAGVQLSATHDGKAIGKEWVFPENPAKFKTPTGEVIVSVGLKTAKVPFILSLKDFRKVDYPGTQNPASFESDVILRDPKENLTLEKTIKMNKPLDYKGYRIFQSSYAQDPQAGEASVFTVAKNPGIFLIYGGACTILVGVIFLFYLHPFFNGESKNGEV